MSPSRLIRRLLRRATRRDAANSRVEVCPPATWGQAEPVWNQLLQWLRRSPQAPEPLAPVQTLERARTDFQAALMGLDSTDAADLRLRGNHARSLRELWHLRPELYGLVARCLSQTEADRRLARVNRHFPSRANGAPNSSSKHHGQDIEL